MCVPQRLEGAADGLVAAARTELGNLPGEPGGIRTSITEAVVQVRLELIERAGAGGRDGQQLLDLGGAGKPAYRSAVQRPSDADKRHPL